VSYDSLFGDASRWEAYQGHSLKTIPTTGLLPRDRRPRNNAYAEDPHIQALQGDLQCRSLTLRILLSAFAGGLGGHPREPIRPGPNLERPRDRLTGSAVERLLAEKRPAARVQRPNFASARSIGPTERSQLIHTNLTREGFAAAAAIVEWDKPANVRVSPEESVIVVDDVPLVECMSSAARSADWLIPAFR
jgi:hypothetical protein